MLVVEAAGAGRSGLAAREAGAEREVAVGPIGSNCTGSKFEPQEDEESSSRRRHGELSAERLYNVVQLCRLVLGSDKEDRAGK